ncbi:unnamed protein product [Debaryomyces fabryi]|nr:unnamed protein product [Debaryomyces fabryi]
MVIINNEPIDHLPCMYFKILYLWTKLTDK